MKALQQQVDAMIASLGGYWPTEEICLRLCEEAGEVCRARRKGSVSDLAWELCDVIFTVTCLANVLGVDLDKAMAENIQKFKHKTSTLAAERASRKGESLASSQRDLPRD